MKKIKCLIIDDEEPARKLLQFFIDKLPDAEVTGVFKNPLEAIPVIENKTADLVFLDIQMNEINGIDLLKALRNRPAIILTTAYRDYAVEGFELEVEDYLLKPFDFNRFLKSFNKVADKLRSQDTLPVEDPTTASSGYIILKEGKNKHKVALDQILYIESENEYVSYHLKDKKILVLDSLKRVEASLPSQQFMRVHRSYIVNKSAVESISSDSRLMIGAKAIPVSNTYKREVTNLF